MPYKIEQTYIWFNNRNQLYNSCLNKKVLFKTNVE